MNTQQTIFTLFFSFYFAATIPITGILRPFDTAAMYHFELRSWIRFVVALLCLNILPLAYFTHSYSKLALSQDAQVTFLSTLGLFFISLACFGFYRIFFGLMLIKSGANYLFYGSKLPARLKHELDNRSTSHWLARTHLVPGIIWVLISQLLGFYLFQANLTLRSTRTPPALPSAPSNLPATSASLSASVQAVPVSFVR